MKYDVVIIGAGQAGLSMGYYLQQLDVSFLILEKGDEIGHVWKERYDSLTLFTPRRYSSLPGLALDGNQMTYPTKDEIADYLSHYAKVFNLQVKLQTTVKGLYKEDDYFRVTTTNEELFAKNIVVATGPFQNPFIPTFSTTLPNNILQLHSSHYKNETQLKDGPVLVVGGGNSGAQIAVELSAKRKTYLSISHKMKFFPQDILTKSIFWWLDKIGIYKASVYSKVGQFVKKQSDPIFGFELKSKIKNGQVSMKPRAIASNNETVLFEDNSSIHVNNIIWSTGFISDYRWIHISDVFDEKGTPIHERGITPIDGLFFLGLPWQHSRSSALLLGVGNDAEYLSKYIRDNR
jgi:putative flavoprotein involved in K+ transport